MLRGKAELRGSLGVDPPVSRVRVWEPLRSLSWQPVRGDRPVSGERVRCPPKRREGASAGLWAQGPPVSRGQCPGVPGALWSRQRPEPPVSRASASLAAASHAQLPLPRGPGSPQRLGLRRASPWSPPRRKRSRGAGRRGKRQEEEERRLRAQEGAGERPSGQRPLPGIPGAGIPKSPAGSFRLRRPAWHWATSL
ncbi:collagen alpha-1(VII) chain-like isoform X2 [Manacus candei]|uniref:collagen alpha-1(VII) chain-like isoform X2 n=1 Tax=Manacus candei TaxID=415023 RepID=UPI0022266B6A|nr:collagen alpha-1(VII) chain-like isoform X2 [Manacus candei]